jgi:hypothetical protein
MTIRSTYLLRILGILYILVGLILVFYPSECLYFLNISPRVFHFTEALSETPEGMGSLWSILAGSQCATLSALCFLAAESPNVRGYNLAHCLAKLISAVCFFYFFVNTHPYFIYVLGGTVESLLFLIILVCFLASFRNQKKPLPPSPNS